MFSHPSRLAITQPILSEMAQSGVRVIGKLQLVVVLTSMAGFDQKYGAKIEEQGQNGRQNEQTLNQRLVRLGHGDKLKIGRFPVGTSQVGQVLLLRIVVRRVERCIGCSRTIPVLPIASGRAIRSGRIIVGLQCKQVN